MERMPIDLADNVTKCIMATLHQIDTDDELPNVGNEIKFDTYVRQYNMINMYRVKQDLIFRFGDLSGDVRFNTIALWQNNTLLFNRKIDLIYDGAKFRFRYIMTFHNPNPKKYLQVFKSCLKGVFN